MRKIPVFLFVALCVFVTFNAGAAGKKEEPAAAETAKTVPAGKYNESPMLAALANAGKLPPVDERVSSEPLVVDAGVLLAASDVDFKIGKYGGTMHYVTARTDVCAELYDATAEPPLMAPGSLKIGSVEQIRPNLMKHFEISADKKEITFFMRKDLKWSDGAAVTTEDVRFWYEDIQKNEDITPRMSKYLKAAAKPGGTPLELDIIDTYTYRVKFAEPGLAFVEWISRYSAHWDYVMRPKHYLKDFHTKYTSMEKLKPYLDEQGLPEAEWWKMFQQKDEGTLHWLNIKAVDTDYPTLSPWMLEKRSSGVVTYTRNPYYWKVDSAGNQLPYIDKIRIEILSDSEAVNMDILAGEVDWARQYASMVNLPLYKENESRGGFKVQFLGMHVAPLQFRFNFTKEEPLWRQIVRDVRFRKALNHAINSAEIVDVVYKGFGKVPTIYPTPYDPQMAKQLLDEMGLNKKDSEGWRLGPDGKRFVFPLEVQKGYTPEQDALCELLVEYFQAVGIKTHFKNVGATLYRERQLSNNLYIYFGWAHTGFWRNAPTTSDFIQDIARKWYDWHETAGKEGEEPLPWAKRLWEIADATDSYLLSASEVKKLHDELWHILSEQVPSVLPMDYGVYPLIGSAKLGNVPHKGMAILASFTQEQFYFK